MQSLKFYLGLVRLLHDAETELGLSELTESDRAIYLALWELSDKASKRITLNYDSFIREQGATADCSRAQFYKTLKRLETLKLIERLGSPRSATYQLLGDV